jgi:hypothetical protein
VLIATQVQYIQHGWINPDSVLYLEAAKFFSNGNWQAGFEVFPWPFYALCIALVNTITQLGVHFSAQLLNVLFFAIATYSYIQIIQLAGGKQKQMIAGALIWLSAQYMIGGVLEMLMRDEGFWALFLLSIVFFIRFYQTHQLKNALLWQVCIIVATLFRIEAITYLILLPFILLFQTGFHSKQKWKHLLTTHAINIGLAVIIILAFTFNDHLSTKLLGRLNEVFTTNLWQQFTQHLNEKSSIMSKQVLGEYLNEFAVPSLLMTFIYVLCVRIISSTGFIVVVLSTFAIRNRNKLLDSQAFQVLSATALIAIVNMALIITKVFVLSGRYVLALSFILMVFAAFYFAELLFKNHQNKKIKWLVTALLLLMLVGAVKNILPKQQGYNYQQEAVTWLLQNNTKKSLVFYDDTRMRFHAGQPITYDQVKHETRFNDLINDNSIEKYEFIVLSHEEKNPNYIYHAKTNLAKYDELKRFYDAKKRKFIIVYKRKS